MDNLEVETPSLDAVYALDKELGRLFVSENIYAEKIRSFLSRLVVTKKLSHQSPGPQNSRPTRRNSPGKVVRLSPQIHGAVGGLTSC